MSNTRKQIFLETATSRSVTITVVSLTKCNSRTLYTSRTVFYGLSNYRLYCCTFGFSNLMRLDLLKNPQTVLLSCPIYSNVQPRGTVWWILQCIIPPFHRFLLRANVNFNKRYPGLEVNLLVHLQSYASKSFSTSKLLRPQNSFLCFICLKCRPHIPSCVRSAFSKCLWDRF